ncbi:MAG: hypothetical protein GF411_19885 [Candidatus Lokiarchaeota archaeon]|nr:hypothetical protein [Candidatus Lokiarchaeota archaeon]
MAIIDYKHKARAAERVKQIDDILDKIEAGQLSRDEKSAARLWAEQYMARLNNVYGVAGTGYTYSNSWAVNGKWAERIISASPELKAMLVVI